MALNANNVKVGTTGAIYVGETSASAPAGATTTLTGFSELGYVSADGVTETRDRSTNQIRAWQNSDLVREVVTEASATFQAVLLETSAATLAAYYGATIDPVDGSIEINPAATGGRKSYVIDLIDGADAIRTYIPVGEILSVGEQVYVNGEPVGYDITITAYASEDGYSYKKFYSALVD
jgi:fructose-1,6-bisphosphatase